MESPVIQDKHNMIREASYADIDQIAGLVAEFFSCGNLEGTGLEIDNDSVLDLVTDVLDSKDSCLYVCEGNGIIAGVSAGFVRPWELNKNIIVLEEFWWFVREDHREKYPMAAFLLLKKLFNWGKSMGATVKIISSNKRAESERVMASYQKMGMVMTDSNFIGRL